MAGYTKREMPKIKTNKMYPESSLRPAKIVLQKKAASVIGMRPFPIISVQSMV